MKAFLNILGSMEEFEYCKVKDYLCAIYVICVQLL